MPSLEEMLKAAELKAAEHHDAWLRAKAETDNLRRRAQEDIAKAQNTPPRSSPAKCCRSRTAWKQRWPPRTRRSRT
jgi:hypothetical protein